MFENCCKDCQKRTITCHIDCPDYLGAVERNNARKERIRKEKAARCSTMRVIHAIRTNVRRRKNEQL